MKCLIIGSGAREHALGWKILRDTPGSPLFFAPGNGGTQLLGTNFALNNAVSYEAVVKQVKPDLVVIGPEAPLVDGLTDTLQILGFQVFGVRREAARLEASKVFAKAFMVKHGIPTAKHEAFDHFKHATAYLEKISYPAVIKADGLAQGKGVVIVRNKKEAAATLENFMEKQVLANAGHKVVIEECLQGQELSMLAFFDNEHFVYLPGCRDYKRLKDGDTGPNTGGMGCVAPIEFEGSLWERFEQDIARRFREGLQKEGILYRGLIYFGLMLTAAGPRVLEFNVRFGDPETQALLPLLEAPLTELMQATAEGALNKFDALLFLKSLGAKFKAGVCVVLASEGYPQAPIKGRKINGLSPSGQALVFHAGTQMTANGGYVTAGGRVLSVVGVAASLEEARKIAYDDAGAISFEGRQFRKDIG